MGSETDPAGFQLILLPYAEDIRDLDTIMEAAGFPEDEEYNLDLSKKEKDAAKLLIKNLTVQFDSLNFENPTIQKFYAGLQALALNEREPEKINDLLEPDYNGMKIFRPVFDNFKQVFFDGGSSDPELGPKPKR